MPDHSPLFSVVIPVYNREKMALRAIASVRAQAFNDYEIVVVDDASTDNSLAVMQAHSADDFHVVALAKNRGVSGARNAGVAAAKGQYIVLLDSDDEFLDGMLEEYAKLVRDNPGLDMIWCGTDCQIEDKDGQIAKQYIEIIRADSQRNSSDDRMFAVRLGTGAGIAMKKQRYL
ncbi:MAG: glycosyltransferase, partial [Nevskiales bacterium]